MPEENSGTGYDSPDTVLVILCECYPIQVDPTDLYSFVMYGMHRLLRIVLEIKLIQQVQSCKVKLQPVIGLQKNSCTVLQHLI